MPSSRRWTSCSTQTHAGSTVSTAARRRSPSPRPVSQRKSGLVGRLSGRALHLRHAGGEVLLPAPVDQLGGGTIGTHVLWIVRLHARVDHDGRRVRHVMAVQFGARGVEVLPWGETCERGPQEGFTGERN